VTTHPVGYLIGSLAKNPINRKLAKALVRLAPPHLQVREISFGELPLYSYDYDPDFPPARFQGGNRVGRCGFICDA
jgi:chromate reductase